MAAAAEAEAVVVAVVHATIPAAKIEAVQRSFYLIDKYEENWDEQEEQEVKRHWW